MRLYLMRHGDAVAGFNDDIRNLSELGRQEAEFVGRYLKKTGEMPNRIWHSELLRSKQTAEGVARALCCPVPLHECRGLRPEDSPEAFASNFRVDLGENVLVVGHLPFVSEFASIMLAHTDSLAVRFSTGTLMGLQSEASCRFWSLKFHITPKHIARLMGD